MLFSIAQPNLSQNWGWFVQLVGFGMAVWHVQENSIHFSGLHHMVGLGPPCSVEKNGVSAFFGCRFLADFFSQWIFG